MSTSLEKVLIDASTNFRSEEWSFDSAALRSGGKAAPFFTVDFFPLHGGRQEGVDIIHVDNGCFELMISPTRGMGIIEAECHGIRLGWDSPVEEIVHPTHVNQEARGGIGWLEGFNEWIVRCGLESNGAPFRNGSGRQYTLHGRIANIPASMAAVHIGTEAPYSIRVVGAVREVCMFGTNFILQTEIATEPGADWIRITDHVTNLRAVPDRMHMLYHCNYGLPIMGKDARLVIPAIHAMPRDRGYSKESVKGWNRELAPTAGINEECWYVLPKADRRGQTRQMLIAPDGDVAVVQEYALKSLPYFAFWKNPAASGDGYVTGLEPTTNFPNPTDYEDRHGRAITLRPGKSWDMSMTISLKTGRKAVAAEEKKIQTIQGRTKIEVLSEPLKGCSPAADA